MQLIDDQPQILSTRAERRRSHSRSFDRVGRHRLGDGGGGCLHGPTIVFIRQRQLGEGRTELRGERMVRDGLRSAADGEQGSDPPPHRDGFKPGSRLTVAVDAGPVRSRSVCASRPGCNGRPEGDLSTVLELALTAGSPRQAVTVAQRATSARCSSSPLRPALRARL
jgi:hypothetical protein